MRAPAPLLDPSVAVLAPFVNAGVLDAPEVHVTATIARATGEADPDVLLAIALAVRAPRLGHVCVVLDEVARSTVVDEVPHPTTVDRLTWPDPRHWAGKLEASPAVRAPGDPSAGPVTPLVFDGTRLYLDRYWHFERRVADDLLRLAGATTGLAGAPDDPGEASRTALGATLDALFGADDPTTPDHQRRAATVALNRRLAIIAGGPGTGKTRTIARLLAAAFELAQSSGRRLEIALAAPTGKAATRMTEAVHAEAEALAAAGGSGVGSGVTGALRATEASTIHRLLGGSGRSGGSVGSGRYGGSGGRFHHNRRNPLPVDLVIVDETSMVSLPLIARLLDAVRPDTTVVLVGDPFQLASVEAGAVLGEIVGPMTSGPAVGPLSDAVVLLDRVHRFDAGSAVGALADAIRTGDPDTALGLLGSGSSGDLAWIGSDDADGIARLEEEAARHALDVVRAARDGDVEAGLARAADFKVLCATRLGDLGASRWSERIESLLAEKLGDPGIGRGSYIGRPVIVTRNDYLNRLYNGDVGLVVASGERRVVAFPGADGVRSLATSRLADLETWWAMTIHKSQGSEFGRVIVTLPPPPSPVLTRELLYTAVTRAKSEVMVVASEASLRAAITRPVTRASGLGPMLWG